MRKVVCRYCGIDWGKQIQHYCETVRGLGEPMVIVEPGPPTCFVSNYGLPPRGEK